MTREETMAFVDALGLEYTVRYVPHDVDPSDKSPRLEWKARIARGKHALETPYSEGWGHIVGSEKVSRMAHTTDWSTAMDRVRAVCRTGKGNVGLAVMTPILADVLYCLSSDSTGADQSFEDWCSDYGYDTDSRKAEGIYRTCQNIAYKLRKIIAPVTLEQLAEAFQDW